MIEYSENSLNQTVQTVYQQLGGKGPDYSVQILSSTRSGNEGVQHINQLFRDNLQSDAVPVYCFNPEFGAVQGMTLERVLLSVGDLVMFTKNDYTINLRNGSLGRIASSLPVEDEQSDCCIVNFEGVEIALKSHQLEALTHSYSITIHKSQGSQFNRVIVPIRQSRLLDQTLIYTVIMKGVDQVILVGDRSAAEAAIIAPALAARRNVTLPDLMSVKR
jgi:exodeoxyribonuclease V alpha subunit